MTDILADLRTAAARKWAGDPAAQQAGLFARAADEIERLRGLLADAESCPCGARAASLCPGEWSTGCALGVKR